MNRHCHAGRLVSDTQEPPCCPCLSVCLPLSLRIHTGTALQQLLRDLGLPYGPNPGKELLYELAEAIGNDDTAWVKYLQQKAIARQQEIRASGGE